MAEACIAPLLHWVEHVPYQKSICLVVLQRPALTPACPCLAEADASAGGKAKSRTVKTPLQKEVLEAVYQGVPCSGRLAAATAAATQSKGAVTSLTGCTLVY